MSLNVLIAAESFPIVYGLEIMVQLVLGKQSSIDLITNFEVLTQTLGKPINYHLLLCATNFKNMDGLTILERTKNSNPKINLLFVSSNANPYLIKRYLEAGANGYICTNAPEDDFKKAIREVYLGGQYIPKELAPMDDNLYSSLLDLENPFDQLSKKEFVVLMLLLKGNGTKDISTILNLKISTTSTFRYRIFKKLDINNLIELFTLAREYHLIKDDQEQ